MSRPILYRVLLIVGILAMVASGWAMGNAASAVMQAPPSPRLSTVAAARPREWVRLDGVVLRCETRAVRGGATFFVATAGDGSPPFVVQLIGDVPCAGATLEGAFAAEPFPRETFEKNARLTLPPEPDRFRFFSEGYGPPYQRTVLRRMVPMFALGIVLVFVALRGLRRGRRASSLPPR